MILRLNNGLLKGEDPITYKGKNYFLNGDFTLIEDNSIPYTFEELRQQRAKKVKEGTKPGTKPEGNYQNGGSLNRTPFMLQGKNLPTAPKAEKRFRKSSYNTTKEGNRETTTITSQTFGYNRNWPYFGQPATILRIVENGDTAFVETPEHHILTKVLPRTALKSGNVYVEYNPKYDEKYSLHGQANTSFNYPVTSLEYETLKRRFNTALNLAK